MEFSSEFIPLKLAEVPSLSDRMKSEHARFVQILAVNTDAGVDLVYSFMMGGGALCNYEVKGVKKTDVVPSITGNFLAAFVFENEIHDLFGVTIEGIAIDFGGKFYQLAQSEPMTIISPAQKAAREKAAKAAEAKRARAAKVAETEYAADHPDAIKQMKRQGLGYRPCADDRLRGAIRGHRPREACAHQGCVRGEGGQGCRGGAVSQEQA